MVVLCKIEPTQMRMLFEAKGERHFSIRRVIFWIKVWIKAHFSLNIPDYKEPAAEERRTEEAAVEQGSNLNKYVHIIDYH